MRLNGNLYEYVAMYVDNLCLGMLDPKSFTDTLQKKYDFKLKGTGPIDFHLGQSFSPGHHRNHLEVCVVAWACITSRCTTCRSGDRDPEHWDNKTYVDALNKDEDDCSGLQQV
jgi:hypothetical protein